MEPTDYQMHYNAATEQIDAIVHMLAEQPARALELATQAGGEPAVQAMIDAVLDQGHRKVLVEALKSPALTTAVRRELESLLFGSIPRLAALLFKRLT
jgi:organic radical activating enzyme